MSQRKPTKRTWFGIVLAIVLAVAALAIPAAVIGFQSRRSGVSFMQFTQQLIVGDPASSYRGVSIERAEKIDFLKPEPIGMDFSAPPKISNLQIIDYDQDGLLDIIVCDCENNWVSWIRQTQEGAFQESILAERLIAPAHVSATDFDGDGDIDLLVAVLGMLFPNNDRIGSVIILENIGAGVVVQHTVIDKVARVSDVRAADLDRDGDQDLAVTQFGYDDGETRWIENLGNWQFRSHILQRRSGGIHCEIADFNLDTHLDIAVLISQEWEEIYIFAGDGQGEFQTIQVYDADNPHYGSSGMWTSDFDQDGDLDLLYANGDAFDYLPPHPRPWHGIQWLENQGALRFVHHRLADYGGAVNLKPADVDNDGDLDLVAVSAFNMWSQPESQSMIWLENQENLRFVRRDIANTPTHIQALAAADIDGDGWVDFVTGGMHVSKPYDRLERVVLWRNEWEERAPETATE